MAITWKGNDQIKTPDGTPLTSHGPALMVLNDVLNMVYVGEGGKNIWQSTTYPPAFPKWETNQQVTIPAGNPLSSFRLALAVFNQRVHAVYVGEGGYNLWWSWYDGGSWAGNVKLPWSGGDPQPALATHNGKLRLVWHDHLDATHRTITNSDGSTQQVLVSPEHNYIYYSALDEREPLQVSSWEEQTLLGDGGELPALASYNGSLYMVLSAAVSNGNPPGTPYGMLIAKWKNAGDDIAWAGWKDFDIVGSNPLSAGGVALAVHNNLLYVVYPGQGGANLWYAYIDTLDVHAGNIQIKTASSVPKTSAPLGLADFQGTLCLAYKGESSNNLWFSYSP